MVTKLKKKVGTSDLNDLEKSLVDKLDKFFNSQNNDNASRGETKDALLFLEKRVKYFLIFFRLFFR